MKTADSVSPPRGGWQAVPGSVRALGFVSMLMDISSEMIHALLPIYMVTVLGTSVLAVGLIEGIAEATASVVKVFSGALSDRFGKRKLLAALGYGLSALTKPVFPLAGALDWLVGARFVDRVGKGIRGAPRDALVADVTPPALRGAAYGLRQALDTVGAFLGPLLAIGLMWLTASHFQTVFWAAVAPAFLAVGVLLVFVREPERPAAPQPRTPLSREAMARLGAGYWRVVAVGAVFTLARFSEAFLILRAGEAGLPPMWAPLVLVLMGIAFSLSAYPAGALSDRMNRMAVLAIGMVCLIAADLTLAFVPGLAGLALGVVLWGIHMGFTQGVFGALIADSAPAELRGTAFGMFHLLTGVALLLASVIAGALWDAWGHRGTFLCGAAFATLTLLGLSVLRRRR
ncbi:MFS transporter [Thauera linaloolentis]|uniref:Major facilitator superfamily transporter n=1 Tax=Thauera linaloolentis (strain DSM 12138 / JCM 21573 / CCUG 41526 / CIP 105981 / IAM 15112 / NBRC 102519 / 47Lol) TaxID=1123367 RepID=N6YNK2_THAL4|nr:MFS transporter [Thauera linaloolentis]ENO83887.1 major facilitator superfamily transporter [Thauera linaloolentis 47Lol = DSM 12138]MCM8566529.1 MFS transporter [Thauera linaloolentis]